MYKNSSFSFCFGQNLPLERCKWHRGPSTQPPQQIPPRRSFSASLASFSAPPSPHLDAGKEPTTQSPWVETVRELKQGRSHGESQGANFAYDFPLHERFAHAAYHCFNSGTLLCTREGRWDETALAWNTGVPMASSVCHKKLIGWYDCLYDLLHAKRCFIPPPFLCRHSNECIEWNSAVPLNFNASAYITDKINLKFSFEFWSEFLLLLLLCQSTCVDEKWPF